MTGPELTAFVRQAVMKVLAECDGLTGPAEVNAVAMAVVMRRIREDVGPAALRNILQKIMEIDRAN